LLDSIPAEQLAMLEATENVARLALANDGLRQTEPERWRKLARPNHYKLLVLLDVLEHEPSSQIASTPAASNTLSTLRLVDELTHCVQQHNAFHIYGHGALCRVNNRPAYMQATGLCHLFRHADMCYFLTLALVFAPAQDTPTANSASVSLPDSSPFGPCDWQWRCRQPLTLSFCTSDTIFL
jgi:hypothetical protein